MINNIVNRTKICLSSDLLYSHKIDVPIFIYNFLHTYITIDHSDHIVDAYRYIIRELL